MYETYLRRGPGKRTGGNDEGSEKLVRSASRLGNQAPCNPDPGLQKPVPRTSPCFVFMLYPFIPMRVCRRFAYFARLMATRNQYRRLDFLHLYKNNSEFCWYYIYCHHPVAEATTRPIMISIPMQRRTVGGGRSNVTWSGSELSSFAEDDNMPVATVYTLTDYIEKRDAREHDTPDVLEISVPLGVLATKLPIRKLVEVCSFHGIRASRSHDTRESIRSWVDDHTCQSCNSFVCIFKAISYNNDNEAATHVVDNAKWKKDELNGYIGWEDVSNFDTYRITGYIKKNLSDREAYRDSIVLDVPLKDLAHRISVKSLVRVCACHGININKGNYTREKIENIVEMHDCSGCGDWLCVFQPLVAVPDNERMRTYRENINDPEGLENKMQCKKWRKLNSFPPKPASRHRTQNIIKGFVEDSEFSRLEEKGCAVCGRLTLKSQLTDLSTSGLNMSLLYRPEVTRKARAQITDPIESLPGPVLASDCDGVCPNCFNVLKKGKTPRNALANGLWLGDIPDELKDLSWMEKRLIARISTNTCVIRVHASKLYKMRTNVVCRAIPMKKVYDVLPPKREEFEEVLAILFIGPSAPTPKEYKRTPLLIRRDRVSAALEWLKLNHADYSDLSISYNNLNDYPEDQPPVYVDYHQTNGEEQNSESTAVNDVSDETCTAEGRAPFIVHGLTGDQISNLWQSDDRRTMRLKAMKYFTDGGKALGIGKSDSMESLWNNPQLYPSMFPWLFPYGMGGLGNESIPSELKISDSVRKDNWLMYYDKRFQHDEVFSIVAFNHQQIKNSRDGGYLLTLKNNFSDVAQRLARIKVSMLDDLISRSMTGHVVPENDSERDCFRLLTDVDYVATHVDGSVTNRRRMRNEIWSMTSYLGAPSWFITFAPADINHPIALYYAGDNNTYYPDVAEHSDRVRLIASNPVAGARFFKFMADNFIKHVLGYGNSGRDGLYGKTSGYYGTVEQQGRLTLHMHMLIWIKHSLNPQELREKIMSNQSDFQTRMVQYLESSHVGEFNKKTMSEMEKLVDLW